jgi:ABC-type Fe3+ transport system permease subunit
MLTAGYTVGVGALFIGLSLLYAIGDVIAPHGSKQIESLDLLCYAVAGCVVAGGLFWLGSTLFRCPRTGSGAISTGAGCAFIQLLLIFLVGTSLPVVPCLLVTSLIHLFPPLMWRG